MPTTLGLVHEIGVAVYLGATVLLAGLLFSVGRDASDAFDRRARFAAVFRVYNPVAIAALGVVVMTGGWSVTAYKEALGPTFFAVMGNYLVGKLTLAFFVIMLGVYIALGICHRIVREAQGALPVTDAALASKIRRLHGSIWFTVLVTLWTIWWAHSNVSLPPR